VYEVDFGSQQLLHASDSYGGAVWALAAAPRTTAASAGAGAGAANGFVGGKGGYTKAGRGGDGDGDGGDEDEGGQYLVAACNDGSLRVLRVVPGAAGCEYVRSLSKVEGKVLSMAWHPEGRALVSGGSDGCIHVWEYRTGALWVLVVVGC